MSKREFLSSDISYLNLTQTVERLLRDSGIETVRDLCGKSAKQLRAINGLGPAKVQQIESSLAQRNLSLSRRRGGRCGCVALIMIIGLLCLLGLYFLADKPPHDLDSPSPNEVTGHSAPAEDEG